MTYIEFFDENAVDNICACLVSAPDRVIFVGGDIDLMETHAQRYAELFSNRGKKIEFICRQADMKDLQEIVDLLSQIITQYDDCVFDLTGGEDLALVAIGIVYHSFRDMDPQLIRFDVLKGTITDCDCDGNLIPTESLPELTVEENVAIYGGRVVYSFEREGATPEWIWSDDFKSDVLKMWSICRRNVQEWNAQIGVIACAEQICGEWGGTLSKRVKASVLEDYLKKHGWKYMTNQSILKPLEDEGLLTLRKQADGDILIRYKNEQIKSCLTVAGRVLELLITMYAGSINDSQNMPVYNDVLNGVCIDWDGETHDGRYTYDTENEVDVILMNGVMPVFVSCKNGKFNSDELHKLNSVAERFGGKYAKKILIATALSGSVNAEYIRQRAYDMDITVIEDIQYMDDKELRQTIKSFCE